MHRRDRNIGTPARKSLLALALLTAGVSGLAGCAAPKPEEMALACPKVLIVRDLAEVTNFRPGGHDLSDVTSRAAITDYSGNCDYTSDGVTVNLKLNILAERGPALKGDQASYSYFVAVAKPGDDTPVSKAQFQSTVDFPAGQARAGNAEDLAPQIPLPKGVPVKDWNAKDWKVFVGFQLTPDQLAFNRSLAKRK